MKAIALTLHFLPERTLVSHLQFICLVMASSILMGCEGRLPDVTLDAQSWHNPQNQSLDYSIWADLNRDDVVPTDVEPDRLAESEWVLVDEMENHTFFPARNFEENEHVFLVRAVGKRKSGTFIAKRSNGNVVVSFGMLTKRQVVLQNIVVAIVLDSQRIENLYSNFSIAE